MYENKPPTFSDYWADYNTALLYFLVRVQLYLSTMKQSCNSIALLHHFTNRQSVNFVILICIQFVYNETV